MLLTNIREKTLQSLSFIVKEFASLSDAYEQIEPLLLGAFNAQRIAIYQRRTDQRDLVSFYKTGSESRELKLAISPQSVVGFVAMTQRAVLINDVYDDQALRKINDKLRFERKYDRSSNFRTQSLICVPLVYQGVLLGVLSVASKDVEAFDDESVKLAEGVAELIAGGFTTELKGTARPFDYLMESAGVSAKFFERFLNTSSIQKGIQTLLSEQAATEQQIGRALGIYYKVPYIGYEPDKYHLTHNTSRLNSSYLKRNHVAVIADSKERLIVLMHEPRNIATLLEIESAIGTNEYQLAYSLPGDIQQYLNAESARTNRSEFHDILEEIDAGTVQSESNKETVAQEDEPAVVRLVTSILSEARRIDASDIHIDPDVEGPTEVRMRVDGMMRDVNQVPASHHNAVVARIKIMAGLNIAEKRVPQDGKLVFSALGKRIEVRVAVIPTVKGEGVTMRLLKSNNAKPIDQIDLAPAYLKRISALMTNPHGIFLVVGPTGAGKTTTLHAILGHLNTTDKKIWTAEDPVEITQHRLNQVQVNPKVGYTFANALRAFLRADPDVILVGEMRDRETAHAAVEASLTGHLVLSTLHTNSAPETITRLLDLGIDPVNFADACLGILAQRLIRTLCHSCKQSYVASDVEIEFIKRQYGEEYADELNLSDSLRLFKAEGCNECDHTGYRGRIGVHELLTMSPDLQRLIYKRASIPELKAKAMTQGMRTLHQDAVMKVLNGQADIQQIQTVSVNDFWNDED